MHGTVHGTVHVYGTVHGTGLGTRLIDALTRSRGARLSHEAVHPGEAKPGTRACLTLTLNADDLCPGEDSVAADFTI